jgi:hypothetical protein
MTGNGGVALTALSFLRSICPLEVRGLRTCLLGAYHMLVRNLNW